MGIKSKVIIGAVKNKHLSAVVGEILDLCGNQFYLRESGEKFLGEIERLI